MEGKSDKDFITRLREHGLQVTYQRLAIYQAVCNTEEHPSAETAYLQVKKKFPMISLGTVYKSLERFHEVGLIKKVSPLTDVTRYDAMIDPHHHFVCMKCQAINDAGDLMADQKIAIPESEGFHVVRPQIILHGYCPGCKPDNVS